MLLAAELALVAIDPRTGRHRMGARSQLNACLAGLLLAELQLEDRPPSPLLDAAESVAAGTSTKAALSAMDRGLRRRLGRGTWDAVVDELVRGGVLQATAGARPANRLVDAPARDEIVERLRRAASCDARLDVRTALVLSMTGPAQLLEVVSPGRDGRRHARHRIDHALDASAVEPIADAVRKVLADAQAAMAAAAATSAVVVATSS